MKTKDLRTWQPKASDAKDVDATNHLGVVARETPDTVSAKSEHIEYTTSSPSPGKLGAQGRM